MNWQDEFAAGKVLLLDKPLRWTSFDVVKKVRVQTKISKVGHAGTLDPLATGLLIVCTGKFTKKINEYMAREKEYTGSITLGSVTPTFDLESEPGQFKADSLCYDPVYRRDRAGAADPFGHQERWCARIPVGEKGEGNKNGTEKDHHIRIFHHGHRTSQGLL
jgi:hypothetical protein